MIIYRDKFTFTTHNDEDDDNNNHNNLFAMSRYKIVMRDANTKFSAVHIPYICLKFYNANETLILNSILICQTFLSVFSSRSGFCFIRLS